MMIGKMTMMVMIMMMIMLMTMVVMMIMATDHGEPERHVIIRNRLAVATEPISVFFCFGR